MTKINQIGTNQVFRAGEAAQMQTVPAQVKVAFGSDRFEKQDEGMSTTTKFLIGAGTIAAIGLGIWALMRGKGTEALSTAVDKAKKDAGKAVGEAAEKVKSAANKVAEKVDKAGQKIKEKAHFDKLHANVKEESSNAQRALKERVAKVKAKKATAAAEKNANKAVVDTPKVVKGDKVNNASASAAPIKPKKIVLNPKIKADKTYQKLNPDAVNKRTKLIEINNKRLYSIDGKNPFTGVTKFSSDNNGVLFTTYKNGKMVKSSHVYMDEGKVLHTVTDYKKGVSCFGTATNITDTSWANRSFRTIEEIDNHCIYRNMTIGKDYARGTVYEPKLGFRREFRLDYSASPKKKAEKIKSGLIFDKIYKATKKGEKLEVNLAKLSLGGRTKIIKSLPEVLFRDVK